MDVSCLLNSMDAPSIPTKTDLQHILNESDDTSPGLFLRTLMSCKNIGFSLTMCVCVCRDGDSCADCGLCQRQRPSVCDARAAAPRSH
jgi:hypothetical protein